jgi:hypothetical protein
VAVRVLEQDDAGRLVIRSGRAQVVEDLAAKAQLLRERAYLTRGDDFFRPRRGVDWPTLKAGRATPNTAAAAVAEELLRDPLTVSATFSPIGDGYRPRGIQQGEPNRVYALAGEVVVVGDSTPTTLEVSLE